MVNRARTPGSFVKGDPRAKGGGRPPLSPEAAELKSLSADEHVKIVCSILGLTREQMQEVLSDPKTTIQKLMVASVAANVIKKGDPYAYEKLMDRIIGRIPLPLQHSGQIVNKNIDLTALPSEVLVDAINQLSSKKTEIK